MGHVKLASETSQDNHHIRDNIHCAAAVSFRQASCLSTPQVCQVAWPAVSTLLSETSYDEENPHDHYYITSNFEFKSL